MAASEEEDVERRCPCGSPENPLSKLWIYCKGCDTWFHSGCVILLDKEVEQIMKSKEEWFCDFNLCQGKKHQF